MLLVAALPITVVSQQPATQLACSVHQSIVFVVPNASFGQCITGNTRKPTVQYAWLAIQTMRPESLLLNTCRDMSKEMVFLSYFGLYAADHLSIQQTIDSSHHCLLRSPRDRCKVHYQHTFYCVISVTLVYVTCEGVTLSIICLIVMPERYYLPFQLEMLSLYVYTGLDLCTCLDTP